MFEKLPSDSLLQEGLVKKESLMENIVDLFHSIVIHLHIIFVLRLEILIYKVLNNSFISQKEQKVRKLILSKKYQYKILLVSPK